MSKHADAFRKIIGGESADVNKGPPSAAPTITPPSAAPTITPPAAPPNADAPPATPPGVNLIQRPSPGGSRDESIAALRKKAEDAEARAAAAEASAAAKVEAERAALQKELEEKETRLAAYSYADSQEFREKFAKPLNAARETAVLYAQALAEDIDVEEFKQALEKPLPEFKSHLTEKGIDAQDKLLALWQEAAVIRAQARAAAKEAPSKLKEIKERERAQEETRKSQEESRRREAAATYAIALRDRVPGFADVHGNPEAQKVIETRRRTVAAVLSEAELSEQAKELVAKGVLFDQILHENQELLAKVQALEASGRSRTVAKPFGLPTGGNQPPRQERRIGIADSSRDAHKKFFGVSG